MNLRKKFEENLPKLERAFLEYPWLDAHAYVAWLAQTYYYVFHSTKLLAYAADKSGDMVLKKKLMLHKKEESGHDHWALADLKGMGYGIGEFKELPETVAIYASIYKDIEASGPAAIMGYAMALEGVSAKTFPTIYPLVAKAYGKENCILIGGHAEADPHHIEAGFKSAELLNDIEKQVWSRVFKETIDRYVVYLNRLKDYAKEIKSA